MEYGWSSLAIGIPRAMQSMFQYLNMIISFSIHVFESWIIFLCFGRYARWDSKVSHLRINPLPQTHKIIKTIFALNWVQSQTKSYMKLIVYNKYMQVFTSFLKKTINYFFKSNNQYWWFFDSNLFFLLKIETNNRLIMEILQTT